MGVTWRKDLRDLGLGDWVPEGGLKPGAEMGLRGGHTGGG